MKTEEMIDELAGLCGILPEYWDIFGKLHTTTVDAKRAMLKAMKMRVESDEDIAREIDIRKIGPWKSFVEPVIVISVNAQPLKIPLYVPVHAGNKDNLLITCVIEDESGGAGEISLAGADIEVVEERMIGNSGHIKIVLSDERERHMGYYTAAIECTLNGILFPDGASVLRKQTKIIITPDTCYLPPELKEGRTWGLSTNLYSLRSEGSWGIGDFKDLETISGLVAGVRGDFIGINPLHAVPNTHPYGISPYSPISRIYKNYIYLHVEDIPEVKDSEEIQTLMNGKPVRKKIQELQRLDLIDYEQTGKLKEKILRRAFDAFYEKHYDKGTSRDNDFKKYISGEGESLESFAVFLVLWNFFRKKNIYAWQGWPEAYHDPNGQAVKKFKRRQEKEVLYHMYLQWLIDEQLKRVSRSCKESGLRIGLYYDLAIGAIAGGSDVWNYQEIIGNADVGAPPDDFNPNGQNWGFPPMIPDNLKEHGYELFIETIRKNMRYGGALRIDHALGLFRLFWIPSGTTPKDGAYLLQPVEDLLRIIALESERNRTIVIAEDLGTIDDAFREMLQSFHMLSYRLFYFEKNYPDPSFKLPERYPATALCAITTHDLPTVYGYWVGRDIEAKKQLGIYGDEGTWMNDVAARERDKRLILGVLKEQGLLTADFPEEPAEVPQMTHELCMAIYRYLAQSPCKLLLVSLDDVIGTLNQQNMPGTVDAHPNWIQKTPLALNDMVHDRRFNDLSGLYNKA
ncbi:MAG: 4-alpha-glucanotransferase [Nitrospirota bacterium]|nr:4-alpha-glucanotransferase [Nitrospirota bacterium]